MPELPSLALARMADARDCRHSLPSRRAILQSTVQLRRSPQASEIRCATQGLCGATATAARTAPRGTAGSCAASSAPTRETRKCRDRTQPCCESSPATSPAASAMRRCRVQRPGTRRAPDRESSGPARSSSRFSPVSSSLPTLLRLANGWSQGRADGTARRTARGFRCPDIRTAARRRLHPVRHA